MRECCVSADTGSTGQGKSAGVMYSEKDWKYKDCAGADRTASVCIGGFYEEMSIRRE